MNPQEYFGKFNCAEAVLLALSDAISIPGKDCIPRVATGFGGGMQIGAVCGAVSGAIIAFGLHCGRMKAEEVEKRDRVNALVKEFTKQFKKKYRTTVCQELLGINVQTEEGRKKYKEDNLHIQCNDYVVTAFKIARTLLSAGCSCNTL